MGHFVRGLQQSGTEVSGSALSSYLSLVIDTLKEVDETRKCYRMVGGVLVERTVKEVLPALENNKEQVSKNPRIDALSNSKEGEARALGNVGRKAWVGTLIEDSINSLLAYALYVMLSLTP